MSAGKRLRKGNFVHTQTLKNYSEHWGRGPERVVTHR